MDERNIEPSAKWEIRRPASAELGRRIYAEPALRGFLAVKRAKKSPCARVRCSYPEPDKTPILCYRSYRCCAPGGLLDHSSVEIKHPTALEVLVAAQARGRHLSAVSRRPEPRHRQPARRHLLAGRDGRPGQSPRRRRRRCKGMESNGVSARKFQPSKHKRIKILQ